MKDANIVESSEQFSADYLGKSKSYFRAMKAQGLDTNNAMLTRLANDLNTRRTLFESVGDGDIKFYYGKWRAIEADVATELALRATDRGSINNNVLRHMLVVI